MDPAKYAEIFLEESREHLTAVNQQLLQWEREPEATEPVAEIFRAVHNIKGMAATMGYNGVATLAHRVENLLDLIRRQERAATPETLDLLFRAADTMEQAVQAAVGSGAELDASVLVGELDAAATGLEPAGGRSVEERPSVPQMAAPELPGRIVQVAIRPNAQLPGARALVALGRVKELGVVLSVHPPTEAMEGDEFDGRFRFQIESEATDAEIEEEIRAAGDVAEVIFGEAQEKRVEPDGQRARHIRVDLRRLDNLMNLIGEMVTARGRLEELSAQRADADLEDLVIRVSHLTRELQTEIIEARMTPGWQIFDRFPRLVRDVARKLGKRVALEIKGKEIELDRAILDEIGDPLVHLLRNAVDHGIESPEEREAAGKPAEGRIVLSAERERSTVIIRVADDGRGIDRQQVLEGARAKGIADQGVDTLRDDELLRVLARPGFSTAESVSDVSGRGVGIDVVMTRLRSFGGSLDLRSRVGVGTTFTLRLPPTLAIMPALLADVGEERYALPLTHVEETVDLDLQSTTEVEATQTIVLRDEVVPLVHLRDLVGIEHSRPPRQPVIILQIGNRRAGLVVDRLGGQREIVVKSFDSPYGTAPIFSGVTVLGDGAVVFILDAGRLV